MIRRFTSGPKPAPARRQVVAEHVALAEPRPEPDAVVAGEVCRRLGRCDDVVRREAVVRVRQADLLDGRAGALEGGHGLLDPRLESGSMPATKYSFGSPRRLPLSPAAASSSPAGRWSSSSGTGTGADVESRSSRPATAWSSVAASRTSRANGPIWSRMLANATIP